MSQHFHLICASVGVPHSPEAVPLVHEKVALVVRFFPIDGLSEAPLHVILPRSLVPAARKHTPLPHTVTLISFRGTSCTHNMQKRYYTRQWRRA